MNKSPKTTWINGQKAEYISVSDRGLQYGDGFFTTLLSVNHQLLNWSAHWWRIQTSALRLQFATFDERALLEQIKTALLDLNDVEQTWVIKLIFTRGQGGRGYQIPDEVHPQVVVQISLAPQQIQLNMATDSQRNILFFPVPKGIEIALCKTQCAMQSQLAGLKHLNRLENVLARTELKSGGFEEGLMLDGNGHIICATQSNLFYVYQDHIITPLLAMSGVAGTTRYQLKALLESLDYQWTEQTVTFEQLQSAEEIFLSNAVRGIMPVKQLESKTYAIKKSLKIHQAWSSWQNQHCLNLMDSPTEWTKL